jgi:hypothetical protein
MIAHRSLLAAFVARRREVTAAIVRRAYREIEAVPLRRTLPPRRIGWAVAATSIGVGLAMGVPRLDVRWPLPSLTPAAVETAAPAAPAAPEPPKEQAAAPATPPPAAIRVSGWDLERRLAAADALGSARAATDAVLAAWQVAPLAMNELADPDDLTRIAWRRGLEMLPLTGNLSMLRLLDLPAVLELRIPGAAGVRFAALVGVDDRGPTLLLDGQRVSLEQTALDKIWLGQARVVWRDFEALGMTLGPRDRGRGVVRLKELLVRAGVYAGTPDAPSEEFDAETERAVVEFQRSRLLVPDSRVGRLTRIVLYGAAGGYARPTLTGEGGAAS